MKIILVNPPFEEEYSVGGSKSIRRVLNMVQPLGLAYLAAVLEKNNFKVRIVDCSMGSSRSDLFKLLLGETPDVVGITASTPNFESARVIAKRIKELFPSVLLIIGGPHVTASSESTMRSSCFDIGVLGEAEETLPELLKHVQSDGLSGLAQIKGIVFREDGRLIITPKREFIEDLDSLPFPARHLLPPLSKYRPTPASYKRLPLATIMTSRGCPFQCVFCDRSVFGNTYRQRSAESVLSEVEEATKYYGAREIRFFDDLFTLDKERTYKICAGMRKKGIPWTCLTSVAAVSKELLKEMKAVGCWQVLYGLESAAPHILSSLRKAVTLEQNILAVRWAKEAGLSVRADFIVGTPQDTMESLNKTLKFAIEMDLDYAHFNKFVPFPGTELYRHLSREGFKFDFSQRCSIVDNSAINYVPPGLNKREYRRFLDAALKKFYLRPSYVVKRLLSIRSIDEFKGQLNGFLAIAGL